MKAQFVPNKAFTPIRKIACIFGKTRGAQFLAVINRLNGTKRKENLSWALWELVSLTFTLNTGRIRHKDLRSIARQAYQRIAPMRTSELRKELNLIVYAEDSSLNIEQFDFHSYLKKEAQDIVTLLREDDSFSILKVKDKIKALKRLTDTRKIEKLLIALEWLRRHPSN